MSDRGMKKWAPFKALKNQEALIKISTEKKTEIECPILSSDQIEKIVKYLNVLTEGQEFELTYYKDGHIHNIKTTFIRVDEHARKITTSDIICSIDLILDIELPVYFEGDC